MFILSYIYMEPWKKMLLSHRNALNLVLFLSTLAIRAEANATHHVVGDDRGWDPSSDVASWATGRIFLVGDSLWFTYSSALENVVEVGGRDEYEACDLGNPIRTYADGLTRVDLEGEGIRYFVSGNAESCNKGLKLTVQVAPLGMMKMIAGGPETAAPTEAPLAPSPTPSATPPVPTPSASDRVRGERAAVYLGAFVAWIFALGFCPGVSQQVLRGIWI